MKTKRVSAYAVAAFAAAIVTSTVSAKTVAWYHFDELEPGTRATGETRFLNAVDPTVAPAIPASKDNGISFGTTASKYPVGVSAFPDGEGFTDPLTDLFRENGKALEFHANGIGREVGSTVLIDNADDVLMPGDDYTIECFFKNTGAQKPNPWQYVFAKWHDPANLKSGLQMTCLDGGMCLILQYYQLDGGTNALRSVAYNTNTQKDLKLWNGRWHHVAVTWKKSAGEIKFYIDYELKTTVAIPEGCTMNLDGDVEKFAIGACRGASGYGSFEGLIDEFRISDTALGPRQFLDVRRCGALPVFPETVVYQRFAMPPAFFGPEVGLLNNASLMRNEAPEDVSLGDPTITIFGKGYQLGADVPAASLATGGYGSSTILNDGAMSLLTTPESASSGTYQKATPSWSFPDVNKNFPLGDFTLEMFFRTSVKTNDQIYVAGQQSAWYLTLNHDGFRVNWGDLLAAGDFEDGRWHHLALVRDSANSKFLVYTDYAYRAAKEVVITAESVKDACITINGYGSSKNETLYDTDVDEIRITKRQLAVTEFLRPARPDVLLDLNFDYVNVCGASSFWQMPTFAYTVSSYDNGQVAGPVTGEGPFEGFHDNTSSLKLANSNGKSGGIEMSDADLIMNNNSFTAEASFRIEPGANVNFVDDCVYLFCQAGWYVRLERDGRLRLCDSDWKEVAVIGDSTLWADGKWHHLAVVHDKDAGKISLYFDYRLIAAKDRTLNITGKTLFIGNGLWNRWQYSFREGWIDNVRVTLKVLEPTEFVNIHPVTGNTLFWTTLDAAKADVETHLERPVETSSGTFVRGNAGKVVDAEGTLLRANGGSVSLASGALSYSRLSLLERKDQTVEFFLKAGAAADGADLVSLAGADASKPIWSLRNVGGMLKVVVTDGNGTVTEVVSAGALPVRWAHFAISFDPAADGSTTTVTVYRDHALFGASATFAGTLAVDGLATSALKVAKFDGQLDELRVSKGTLPVADMLYGLRTGLFFLVR